MAQIGFFHFLLWLAPLKFLPLHICLCENLPLNQTNCSFLNFNTCLKPFLKSYN